MNERNGGCPSDPMMTCVLHLIYEHGGGWFCKPRLEAHSLEQWGYWKSVVVITANVQVCDYSRQCSPTPVAFDTCPSPQDLKVCVDRSVIGDDLHNWPVCESFIVRRPVHRGNPTLSVWEVLIQWHGEPLQQETARLQWMTRTSLDAISCSRRSNDTCCHRLQNHWIFRWDNKLVQKDTRNLLVRL